MPDVDGGTIYVKLQGRDVGLTKILDKVKDRASALRQEVFDLSQVKAFKAEDNTKAAYAQFQYAKAIADTASKANEHQLALDIMTAAQQQFSSQLVTDQDKTIEYAQSVLKVQEAIKKYEDNLRNFLIVQAQTASSTKEYSAALDLLENALMITKEGTKDYATIQKLQLDVIKKQQEEEVKKKEALVQSLLASKQYAQAIKEQQSILQLLNVDTAEYIKAATKLIKIQEEQKNSSIGLEQAQVRLAAVQRDYAKAIDQARKIRDSYTKDTTEYIEQSAKVVQLEQQAERDTLAAALALSRKQKSAGDLTGAIQTLISVEDKLKNNQELQSKAIQQRVLIEEKLQKQIQTTVTEELKLAKAEADRLVSTNNLAGAINVLEAATHNVGIESKQLIELQTRITQLQSQQEKQTADAAVAEYRAAVAVDDHAKALKILDVALTQVIQGSQQHTRLAQLQSVAQVNAADAALKQAMANARAEYSARNYAAAIAILKNALNDTKASTMQASQATELLNRIQTRASGAQRGIGGNLFYAVKALNSYVGAAFALEAVAFAFYDVVRAGNELEKTHITLRALSGTTQRYTEVVAAAQSQQGLFGGSLQQNLEDMTSFSFVANQTGLSIEALVNIARRLAILDPQQGIKGAAIALKEFFSGMLYCRCY